MFCRKHLFGCVEDISSILWHKSRESSVKINYKCFATGPPYTRRRVACAVSSQVPLEIKTSDLRNVMTLEENSAMDRDSTLVMDMNLCSSSDEDVSSPRESRTKVENCLCTFRYKELTEYGRTLQNPSEMRDCITVVSYNVLAQTLLGRHKYLYKNCDSRCLPWRSRKNRLREEFKILNADILCLQEVEAEHVKGFYECELGKLGYRGVYKQRTGDKIDGCAIYFKTEKFKLVNQHCVELYKDNVRLLDRDNIGIILRLRGNWPGAGELVVATTHLLYNPRRSDIRLTQTQIMLAEIEKAAYNYGIEYCPVIFTGDMNYTPQSAVYELVTEGLLVYEGQTDRQMLHKRLLPPSVGVTDRCQYTASLEERRQNGDVLFETGILSHELHFGSAYPHFRNGLPEATTYQDAWQTVDYIYYSQRVRRGMKEEGRLKLVSRVALPTSDEADTVIRELPNPSCGSDHLPLCATFHLDKN